MKYILLFAAVATISSCSTHSPTPSDTQAVRGPASTGKKYEEKLWGKKITHNEADFLEGVENTPAQKY